MAKTKTQYKQIPYRRPISSQTSSPTLNQSLIKHNHAASSSLESIIPQDRGCEHHLPKQHTKTDTHGRIPINVLAKNRNASPHLENLSTESQRKNTHLMPPPLTGSLSACGEESKTEFIFSRDDRLLELLHGPLFHALASRSLPPQRARNKLQLPLQRFVLPRGSCKLPRSRANCKLPIQRHKYKRPV